MCPNAEGHPPSPPFKGGKSEEKGGCYPFKGGKSEAKRWENRPNANFANGRKLTRITVFVIPNTPFVIPNAVRNLARKKKEILRFALNDKLMVNCQWLIVMPGYPNANFANGANQRCTPCTRKITIDN